MDKKSKIKTVCTAAVLCAISCVVAACCKALTFGSIRITFENLALILCGYLFGPIAGFGCAVAADLLNSCVFYGIGGINPIITLGAGCVGLFAGLGAKIFKNKNENTRLLFSVSLAHIFGNMIMKSLGLALYYSYPFSVLILRVPLYIGIGAIEYFLLRVLVKTEVIKNDIRRGA